MPRKSMKGKTVAMICQKHGFIKGDRCPICSQNKVREGVHIEVFKPMVYTDICETPILIESKRQLREECRKHNVIACRLM